MHASGYRSAVAREYNNNFNTLKETQLNLAKRRNSELALQRDFLLTKPENAEDLKTVGL